MERIALMMEAVQTSETSVNFYETSQRNIPEDCHFLSRHYFCFPLERLRRTSTDTTILGQAGSPTRHLLTTRQQCHR